jgi:hypothetical protein
MFNRMTTFRIASVALAASAIFSPVALADAHKHHSTHISSVFAKKTALAHKKSFAYKNSRFATRQFNSRRFNGHRSGYSSFHTIKLKRHALSSCSTQLRQDAYKFGYKGARLTDTDIKQVGKNTFIVYAGAKLYDGYSFSHQPYECTVKHGRVIDAYKPKKLKF